MCCLGACTQSRVQLLEGNTVMLLLLLSEILLLSNLCYLFYFLQLHMTCTDGLMVNCNRGCSLWFISNNKV